MKKKIFYSILIFILLTVTGSALFYTQPVTLSQLYPFLDFSQCAEIHGYYSVGNPAADSQFSVKPEDKDFPKLMKLVEEKKFRRSLSGLLPSGTKTHRTQDKDFRWEVMLHLENQNFPDGSCGSGDIVRISNFFGKVSVYCEDKSFLCKMDMNDPWLCEIMELISQEKHLVQK